MTSFEESGDATLPADAIPAEVTLPGDTPIAPLPDSMASPEVSGSLPVNGAVAPPAINLPADNSTADATAGADVDEQNDSFFSDFFDSNNSSNAANAPDNVPPAGTADEKPVTVKKHPVKGPRPKPLVDYNYRTQTLPQAIYRKDYSKYNQHLPSAVYEQEIDNLLFISASRNDINTLRQLLNNGRSVESSLPNGESLLNYAVRTNAEASVRFLLARGANPQSTNQHGLAPLHFAAFSGNAIIAEALLEKGANPDQMDSQGLTPLWYAVRQGRAFAAASLLKHGALVDRIYPSGETVLHLAARAGMGPMTRLLARYSQNIDQRDRDGYTPLMLASFYRHTDAASALLDAGADPTLQDNLGQSAEAFVNSRGLYASPNARQPLPSAQMGGATPAIAPQSVTR